MHAIIAATLFLLPATAQGWFLENGTDFVVKPWSQQQTLAVRRRKRGWIAIQQPTACEPEHVVCVATPHNTNTRLTGRHWQHGAAVITAVLFLISSLPRPEADAGIAQRRAPVAAPRLYEIHARAARGGCQRPQIARRTATSWGATTSRRTIGGSTARC